VAARKASSASLGILPTCEEEGNQRQLEAIRGHQRRWGSCPPHTA
jgi:hypothetical protein